MKKIFTTIIAIVITVCVFAQSPQKMSYQAVIRDASNVLVTSHAIGMRISILQGSESGTPIYVETQTPTTNANGLATIEIGGGITVTGTFAGIDWSAGTYFLKTETDPTGGTNYTAIVGTNQLLSVPYALFAGKAGVDESSPCNGLYPLIDSYYNELITAISKSGSYTSLLNPPVVIMCEASYTTSGSTAILNWIVTDPLMRTLIYDVYIQTASTSITYKNLLVRTLQVHDLEVGDIHWRVIAKDYFNNVTIGELNVFTVPLP